MHITIFVGPPCSGKSRYLDQLQYDVVISSDSIVEALCAEHNIAYQQFFSLVDNHPIKKQHQRLFKAAIKDSQRYQHVVWDLTSLTRKSRARIMAHYPSAVFSAVVFDFKGQEALLLKRNTQRFKHTGKYIDEKVLINMCENFQPVSLTEGFTDIIHVAIS